MDSQPVAVQGLHFMDPGLISTLQKNMDPNLISVFQRKKMAEKKNAVVNHCAGK